MVKRTTDGGWIPWTVLVEDSDRTERITLCRSCEFFATSVQTCSKCFCIMPIKTMWADAECPEGKWAAIAYGVTDSDNS
tara:strand:- start:273 stop:509 length:237 start_codon:yes stop_codon:yes gene_type:complete